MVHRLLACAAFGPPSECNGAMRISGLRVVVTGASAGIGRATAMRLAKRGAEVVAVARRAELLDELAATSSRITAFPADLAQSSERRRLVADTGPVDVLVNNAGIGWLGLVDSMPFERVQSLFELNVLGLIELTQLVMPQMAKRRKGHIVNIASVASYAAVPPLTVYSASKFAVRGFTEGLRRELGGTGITACVVNPGITNTGFVDRAQGGDRPDVRDKTTGGVPADFVARAIQRSITYRRVPGFGVVAAPRIWGVSRLAAVPGVNTVVDIVGAPIASRFRTN